MKTYTLTNENWYRGQGRKTSFMVWPAGDPGPVCCLGNVMAQEGLQGTPGQAVISLQEKFRLLADLRDCHRPTWYAGKVYALNDDSYFEGTDTDRVAAINAIVERFGFRFEFVG